MRSIIGQLTPELEAVAGELKSSQAPALQVAKFRELLHHVARLAYANKDHLLFFRGQSTDHRNKALASTFYPTIYRGERVVQEELKIRFDLLNSFSLRLAEAFKRQQIEGAAEVRKRRLIQWSILQHYEVCATPLLDFTQSLRVACSFATLESGSENPYVFVFGLPYLTNRISVNSEHDLVNIKLLSICPPDALRPLFQEGYLAGTDEVTIDYDSKPDLDFNNRLIAKFQISRSQSFWDGGFDPIRREALYPSDDRIKGLCAELQQEDGGGIQAAELGQFLQAWAAIESRLISLARTRKDRVFSTSDAIRVLQQSEALPPHLSNQLNELRKVRNLVVHSSSQLKANQVSSATKEILDLSSRLKAVSVGEYTRLAT
jgi:hypothetical protein